MVRRYGEKVRFVSEDWGRSELAARFDIKRYPVVFVDDVLVAQPKDFGGWGQTEGAKYAPWRDPANQAKFQADLSRVIDLLLRGDTAGAARASSEADTSGDVAALPAVTFVDLAGRRLGAADLGGRVVVVELWATWCVPCRSTLEWLATLEREYGDRVAVLAVAVQSEEKDVRALAGTLRTPAHVVAGGDALAPAFGGVTSVPVLYVFGREGKTAAVIYGAPKNLHERVKAAVDAAAR